ncbi:DUF4133 domain-containing protein [Pontibacter litorisediminis]|uniref:DUF4133 domain-containing protein n=1 Tax=Pontibacter litorisediminis TaxID=1846260 RepID=UPI0023ECE086|nr:DUF4133 domain-containing protein [Pontibacter litorisediminis]
MDTAANAGFEVYKGLQKPLVFKSLKGRYIYWGLSCVASGFLAAVVLSVAVNFFCGLLALLVITGGCLCFTAMQQKKGLHQKTRSSGIYIMPTQWRRPSPVVASKTISPT